MLPVGVDAWSRNHFSSASTVLPTSTALVDGDAMLGVQLERCNRGIPPSVAA